MEIPVQICLIVELFITIVESSLVLRQPGMKSFKVFQVNTRRENVKRFVFYEIPNDPLIILVYYSSNSILFTFRFC